MIKWEEAADRTIRSLEHQDTCTPETKTKIREYYKASAVDGKFPSVSEGYSGMMVWDVKH